MVDKVIKCPICNEITRFILTEESIAGKMFPVPCIIHHNDHAFIAYLDSELSLCDIEKPFIIKTY
ncbi:MAG: hypothetical protein ACFFD2_16350 [Promethearchaeota archaeon]